MRYCTNQSSWSVHRRAGCPWIKRKQVMLYLVSFLFGPKSYFVFTIKSKKSWENKVAVKLYQRILFASQLLLTLQREKKLALGSYPSVDSNKKRLPIAFLFLRLNIFIGRLSELILKKKNGFPSLSGEATTNWKANDIHAQSFFFSFSGLVETFRRSERGRRLRRLSPSFKALLFKEAVKKPNKKSDIFLCKRLRPKRCSASIGMGALFQCQGIIVRRGDISLSTEMAKELSGKVIGAWRISSLVFVFFSVALTFSDRLFFFFFLFYYHYFGGFKVGSVCGERRIPTVTECRSNLRSLGR